MTLVSDQRGSTTTVRDSCLSPTLVSCRVTDLGSFPTIGDVQASFEREPRN